jgi:hypothetical protein
MPQAGTASDEYQDWLGRWVATYFAWYQDFPNEQNGISPFGVNCGDTMQGEAYQDGSNAHMFIEDLTSNQYANHSNSNLSNGSSAEWIVERPKPHGATSLPGLSDFRWVSFWDCRAAQNGLYYSIVQLPSYNKLPIMWGNDWGTQLATTGDPSQDSGDPGASFTVNWQHYGP